MAYGLLLCYAHSQITMDLIRLSKYDFKEETVFIESDTMTETVYWHRGQSVSQ